MPQKRHGIVYLSLPGNTRRNIMIIRLLLYKSLMEDDMTQSSIAKSITLSLLFSASIYAHETVSDKTVQCEQQKVECTQKAKCSKGCSHSATAPSAKTTDIEKAVKKFEDASSQLKKQHYSATSKMNGAIKQAKYSEACTIKVGDISITVDKGNENYLKIFVFTVLFKEILKQYDKDPTVATQKMINHGKRSFTSFARAVGLMKVPVPVKKSWWQF